MDDLPMYPVQAKLFNLVTAEHLGTLPPDAPIPTFLDFISVFSFFCEDVDDVEVGLFFRVPCSE